MRAPARAALGAAVVFSVAMGALSEGGWWWAWFAGIAVLLFGRGVRLPLLGVRLDPATRFILRENRKTRRDNHAIAQQRRRSIRNQRRAARQRRRQTQ